MTPLELVNKQAEDEGLWFLAATAPEAYLQNALRELHTAVERDATQGGGVDVTKLHAVFDDLLSPLSERDRLWTPFLNKTMEVREAIDALKGGGVDAGKVKRALSILNYDDTHGAPVSGLAISLLEQALAGEKGREE